MWCVRFSWVLCVAGSGSKGGCLSPNHTGVSTLLLEIPTASVGVTQTNGSSWPACWLCLDWKCHHICKTSHKRAPGGFLLTCFCCRFLLWALFFKREKKTTNVIYWSECRAQLSPFIKNYSYYYRNGTQTNRNYPQFSIVKDHSWDWTSKANPQGYWENYIIIYKAC